MAMTHGKTRSCPHCKATILESATVCPACQHHLRFDPAAQRMLPTETPLRVEGSIRHPPEGDTWEYSIVVAVRNERGEEVTRQVAGVGALGADEVRSFTLSVELFVPQPQERELRSEPRAVPAASAASVGRGGPPPLPRDPRPPARETQVRTLPVTSLPLSKDRPRK
jgi:hypothetical protein